MYKVIYMHFVSRCHSAEKHIRSGLTFLLLIFIFSSGMAEAADTVIKGLRPAPALTVYYVNQQPDAVGRISIRRGRGRQGDRLMIRMFDPDEKLALWQYVEPGRVFNAEVFGENEVEKVITSVTPQTRPGDLMLDMDLLFPCKGIYQIRVTAGESNSDVNIELPGDDYGISFQNGYFSSWKNQPDNLYMYIPPHAEELVIEHGKLEINGKEVKNKFSIPSSEHRKTWQVKLPSNTNRMLMYGFPVILCSSVRAAEEIKASVIESADGTVFCWKFQADIHNLLKELLQEKYIGKTEDLVADWSKVKDSLTGDPVLETTLLTPFDALMPAINPLLKSQNLDPQCHWSGAMDGWQDKINASSPENRWDRLRNIPRTSGGVTPADCSAGAEKLALAATFDFPGNPYFNKKELLFRAAASALRDLTAMGEDEVWRGTGHGNRVEDPYPGFMAFSLGQQTMPVFALVAPHMPDNIRKLWSNALRHIIDRAYPDGLVSCRNQSSHYLVAFQAFAIGSGEPRYAELAKHYARRFSEGTHPAGFQVEAMGPDAGYTGMSHWHMAVYYRMSGDKDFLETIRRSYFFFNHTVAPEPEGGVIGSNNFSHRTRHSFDAELWGGAKGILDDVLPEVGVWAKDKQTSDSARADIVRAIKAMPETMEKSRNKNIFRYSISPVRYEYFAHEPMPGILPALEKNNFIRNIANELVAVKRPGYYAAIYVGKPAPVAHYIRRKENFRDESKESKRQKYVAPFLGGGLSLLSSPDYGTLVVSSNRSPLYRNGLLAYDKGKRYWEDYFATSFKLDEKSGILSVSGRLEKVPVKYTRTYTFADDALYIKVELQAEKELELERFVEVIPLAQGKAKSGGFNMEQEKGQVKIRNNAGKGFDLILPADMPFASKKGAIESGTLRIDRLELELPEKFSRGQKVSFGYSIKPVDK
ncbi:MAG: hypothetical protein JXR78_05280 [Victivallales bacterium]|nr:hypothetical protein [Victivallales bacterium]